MPNNLEKEEREFRFNLGEAYQYNRFPMKRLAEYLSEINTMVGEEESAYFVRLDKGSTVLVVQPPQEKFREVINNLHAVVRGSAPPHRIAAYRRVENMREEDHALKDIPIPEDATNIIQFPVPELEQPFELTEPNFGWVDRFESVQGIPIQVGDEKGKEGKRRVILRSRDGRIHKFETTDEIAQDMGHFLFKRTFRAEGTAQWKRTEQGWKQRNFRVTKATPLPETTLDEDIAALRAHPAKWKEREDPLKDLDIIRHEDDVRALYPVFVAFPSK